MFDRKKWEKRWIRFVARRLAKFARRSECVEQIMNLCLALFEELNEPPVMLTFPESTPEADRFLYKLITEGIEWVKHASDFDSKVDAATRQHAINTMMVFQRQLKDWIGYDDAN